MPNLYLKQYLVSLLLFFSTATFAQSKVIVTIKPLHAISSFLLQGVDKPALLMAGLQSPHHFQLKPSQARLIRQAKLVVWVGENIESSLANLLSKIEPNKQVHFFEDAASQHNHHINQHYWLDPILVLDFANTLANKLLVIYPKQQAIISANLALLTKKLLLLNQQIKQQLSNKNIRFISIHNDLLYFSKRYQLQQLASLQKSDHQKPSLKDVLAIKKQLKQDARICIVSSGVVPSKWAKIINPNHNKSILVDNLAVKLKQGSQLYFTMMKNLSDQLSQCANP